MYFIVIVLACSLNPDFNATKDRPQLCIRFMDSPQEHYATKKQCEARAKQIFYEMATNGFLDNRLPGPHEWKYKCPVPPETEPMLSAFPPLTKEK